jgi:small subunit ribosomal protein S11
MAEDKVDEIKPKATAEEPETDAAVDEAKPKVRKKKARRTVSHGQVHVLATFNNTIVNVTDSKGNVLTTASAGSSGFRGSKKGTAYAAQIAAEKAITSAKQTYGINKVDVIVKGIGMGREAAVRTLAGQNVAIDSVKDITTVPHGGVRPRLPKRN